MSNEKLKDAVSAEKALAKKEAVSFPQMLEVFKDQVAKALPAHLTPDRMVRIALTAFRRQPKLAQCDPRSVFACVVQSAQLGLELDTLGRAYLVPFEVRKNVDGQWRTVGVECQFIPGWKGLVDLVNRDGRATVWTGAVFEGDFLDYDQGDTPKLKHRQGAEFDQSKLTHVYAIGRVKGSEWPIIECWPIAKVIKHRDRYNKVGKRHYSFDNLEMYARKVVLLQVLKYMPMSATLARAVELDNAAEMGRQKITVEDAAADSWVAPADDTQDADFEDVPAAPKTAKTAGSGVPLDFDATNHGDPS